MKLTKAQKKVIDRIVEFHRVGRHASIYTGPDAEFDGRPIKFLVKNDLINRLPSSVRNHYLLEIAPKGWDHIYKEKA